MKEKYHCVKDMYKLDVNGLYCGVFVPIHVKEEIIKISKKWTEEIKKVLNENKDELLTADWSMYSEPDENGSINKAQYVRYSDPEDIINGLVDRRIDLFSPKEPEKTDVYICTREQAEEIAKELYHNGELK